MMKNLHRHAMLVDQETNEVYVPMNNLGVENQGGVDNIASNLNKRNLFVFPIFWNHCCNLIKSWLCPVNISKFRFGFGVSKNLIKKLFLKECVSVDFSIRNTAV